MISENTAMVTKHLNCRSIGSNRETANASAKAIGKTQRLRIEWEVFHSDVDLGWTFTGWALILRIQWFPRQALAKRNCHWQDWSIGTNSGSQNHIKPFCHRFGHQRRGLGRDVSWQAMSCLVRLSRWLGVVVLIIPADIALIASLMTVRELDCTTTLSLLLQCFPSCLLAMVVHVCYHCLSQKARLNNRDSGLQKHLWWSHISTPHLSSWVAASDDRMA
jgi:hypothetical protein